MNCRHVRDEPGEIFGEPRRHNNQPQQRLTLLAEKYSCARICSAPFHLNSVQNTECFVVVSSTVDIFVTFTGSRKRRGGSYSLGGIIFKEANHRQPLAQPTPPKIDRPNATTNFDSCDKTATYLFLNLQHTCPTSNLRRSTPFPWSGPLSHRVLPDYVRTHSDHGRRCRAPEAGEEAGKVQQLVARSRFEYV